MYKTVHACSPQLQLTVTIRSYVKPHALCYLQYNYYGIQASFINII